MRCLCSRRCLHLSAILQTQIVSQIKVEQQKDVISLLLYDFEENASDWIWEIDVDGRIRNPSRPPCADIGEKRRTT